MKLKEIAHSRTGDKGNISNISVIAYDDEDYAKIEKLLTPEKVKTYFGDMAAGKVIRYELPQLGALNFVLHQALGGGVTRSLRLDKHGKTLSSILLEMEMEEF